MKTVMTKNTMTMETGIKTFFSKRKNKRRSITKAKKAYAFWKIAFSFLLLMTPIIKFESLKYAIMDENTAHIWYSCANSALTIPDLLSLTIGWGPYQSQYWCSIWILDPKAPGRVFKLKWFKIISIKQYHLIINGLCEVIWV